LHALRPASSAISLFNRSSQANLSRLRLVASAWGLGVQKRACDAPGARVFFNCIDTAFLPPGPSPRPGGFVSGNGDSGRRQTRDCAAPVGAHLPGAWTRLRLTVIGCAVIAGTRHPHVADEEPEVTRRACWRRRQPSERDERCDKHHPDEGEGFKRAPACTSRSRSCQWSSKAKGRCQG